MEKKLPMSCRLEDATLGNMYAGHCISGDVKKVHTVRTGIEYMMELAEWYTNTSAKSSIAFSRSRRIAGDFPICVVRCCTRICSAITSRSGLLLPDK